MAGTPVVARADAGGYVESAIIIQHNAYPVPETLDLRSAMALMDDGSTALALLERTPVRAGERVLVAPGLGGLGSLLTQLALAAGATVIAGVRGAEKIALVRNLGAEAIDYSAPDWCDQVNQVDVVFDGIGGSLGAAAATLLVDGGRFSGYGMTSGSEATIGETDRRRLTVVGMSQLPTFWPDAPRRVRHVLGEAAAGRLTPIIGQTYSLADAAAAHTDIEARRFTGKTLLLT